MSFKDNLKRIRQQKTTTKPMSQADLAGLTGLEPSTISHFETGKREPCLRNLIKLSAALNVTLDELVNGTFHD